MIAGQSNHKQVLEDYWRLLEITGDY